MKRLCLFVLALLAVSLLAFPFAGCAATGGASPIVGVIEGEFSGVARSDGEILFVRGKCNAKLRVQSKYGGLPLTIPVELAEDGWLLLHVLRGESVSGKLGVDLIPIEARALFAQGEIAEDDPHFERMKQVAPPVLETAPVL